MATERHAARRALCMLAAVLGLAAAGCAGTGLMVTRTTAPYSRDFHATPGGARCVRADEQILREPLSGANLSVDITARVLATAARSAGLTNFYYADLETFSLLGGLYERKQLVLYGD